MFEGFPPQLIFNDEHKRLLQEVVIDQHQPGTILADFATALAIIKANPPVLTDKEQLPLSTVTAINARLKHPIEIALKRSQQKYYPHVHGLYLLVRASGLTYIETSGKKKRLMIDEGVYKQWTGFNPTEQYGSLLEVWLLRGYEDIIGERARFSGIADGLDEILRFILQYDLGTRLQVTGNRLLEDSLRYFLAKHNQGLLDLFGLMRIESGPPRPGKGWNIEHIALTDFGSALLSLIYNDFFKTELRINLLFSQESAEFGGLHNILKPYWSAWKNNFTEPKTIKRKGAHIFKVSLRNIWRRIEIDGKVSLEGLAAAILNSVDFDSDHLYEFTYRNRIGTLAHIYHPYMDEAPDTSEILVGEVGLNVGQSMTFLFDFGGNYSGWFLWYKLIHRQYTNRQIKQNS